jgi:hypothetical protein
MWDKIKYGKDTLADISWVVNGTNNGSLIWATDGSYDQKKAVDLCRVGWMIFCTNMGYRLMGTFWGTIFRGKLVSGRTPRPLRSAPVGTSYGRVLQTCQVVCHVML